MIEDLIVFFDMGGYGQYIWSVFAAAFIVLLLNYFIPMRKRRRLLAELRKANESLT